MSPAPWFERKFDFSLQLELLPNLCTRLRGTPARLEEILEHVPSDILTRKLEGAWSAQENAGHLVDLESLWLARVKDYAETKDELTAADLQNRKTDDAHHNDRDLELILLAFRTERRRLMEKVQALEDSFFLKAILHPRLRVPMRLIDHLYFVAEHDDHHLARIWELVAGNQLSETGNL